MDLFSFFKDALFPPSCAACGAKLGSSSRFPSICDSCFSRIGVLSGFSCPVCHRRLPSLAMKCHSGAYRFGAAADFGTPEVRALVHALKYGGRKDAARPLGTLIGRYLAHEAYFLPFPTHEATLIPVPLHPRKERMRGYNQTQCIADAILEELGGAAPLLGRGYLKRIRNTISQTEQENAEARRANICGAFSLLEPECVRGKYIIILDDVATTGATLREAVKTVRRGGAASVFALAAARA